MEETQMDKVSISDIAKAVAAKNGISQANAEAFVTDFFNVINEGLHSDKAVKVRGLGTFKVIDVRERESVNVNTGERVTIEGHGKINFTPDPIIRDLVNKPFAKFDTVVLNEGVDIDELNKVNDTDDNNDIDEEFNNDINEPSETLVEAEAEPEDTTVTPTSIIEENVVEPMSDDIELSTTAENQPDTKVEETPTEEPKNANIENVNNAVVNTESILTKKGNEATTIISKTPEPQQTDVQTEEDNSDDNNTYEEEEENISFCSRHKKALITIGLLLTAIVFFAGGYLLGQNMASRPVFKTIKVYNIVKPKAKTDSTATAAKPIETDSTTKVKQVEAKEDAEENSKKSENSAEITHKEDKAELTTAQRQVKTGAYTIIGTDQAITIKKGQTLKQVSKLYLGDGMECYIQVHNNVSDISEGMKIKIPKLKLKKR